MMKTAYFMMKTAYFMMKTAYFMMKTAYFMMKTAYPLGMVRRFSQSFHPCREIESSFELMDTSRQGLLGFFLTDWIQEDTLHGWQ